MLSLLGSSVISLMRFSWFFRSIDLLCFGVFGGFVGDVVIDLFVRLSSSRFSSVCWCYWVCSTTVSCFGVFFLFERARLGACGGAPRMKFAF